MRNNLLKNKVVAIIGASSGIGYYTAEKLLHEGYSVYNLSRTKANYCRYCEPRHENLCCDVMDGDEIRRAINTIVREEGRIDALVYSAGCSLAAPLEHTTEQDFRRVFEVNYFGLIKALWEVIPIMREQREGRIVAISSMAGSFPVPFDAPYSASKAAIDITIRTLAVELKPFNIRLSSVSPGGVSTGFTFKRKIYQEDDVGEYHTALDKAATRLANIEQSGLDPRTVADSIAHILSMKNPPVMANIGLSNKALKLVNRVLPTGAADALNRMVYRQ